MLCAIWSLNLVPPLEASPCRRVFVLYSTRQSSFVTHPPPLVKVDQAPVGCLYPRCMRVASSVADSSHNLVLCDEVMSMQ